MTDDLKKQEKDSRNLKCGADLKEQILGCCIMENVFLYMTSKFSVLKLSI